MKESIKLRVLFSLYFGKIRFSRFFVYFGVHLKQLQITNNKISDLAPSVLLCEKIPLTRDWCMYFGHFGHFDL